GNQQGRSHRQAAERRREREDGQPGEEETAPSQRVGEASAQQEQTTERQGVTVDHPGQADLREGEIVLDRSESDLDRGGVQQQHELGGGQYGKAPAATPGGRVDSRGRQERWC